MLTSHPIGFIIVIEICVIVWKVEQDCNRSYEIKFMKLICDLGAQTISYTLHFLHEVIGIFFLSGMSQIILKADVCGNHVSRFSSNRGREEFLTTIS